MKQLNTIRNYARRGIAYYRKNGARLTAARFFLGVSSRLARPRAAGATSRRKPIELMTTFQDATRVDWTSTPAWAGDVRSRGEGPYRTAWIMSPPGKSSGGHQNIFRFISFLENAGHEATIYLYSSSPVPIEVDDVRQMVKTSIAYPNLNAAIEIYDPAKGVGDVDALFATGWETTYPAYRDPSMAKRCYFVQDFEPSFYSVGTQYHLAENSYRFGFEGFTAGRWLSTTLAENYGMKAHPFDFATDLAMYQRTNDERRNGLFFYARPVTTRRGFEFGIMVLAEVKRLRPHTQIHMGGWDVSDWDIPFDYVNHGAMSLDQLSAVYNECAAALVMSLTNMSLLPLELLSCGTIPVVNDAPNNRLVSNNPNIAYAQLSPQAMAQKIIEILDADDQVEKSREAAQSVAGLSWAESGKQFVSAFEGAMRG